MSMNEELQTAFDKEMKALYKRVGEATGYWPKRFLQKVNKVGGLSAARFWLAPGRGLSPGLQRLAREKRVDLSMETLVQEGKWSQLFTQEEILEAKRRVEAALIISEQHDKRPTSG